MAPGSRLQAVTFDLGATLLELHATEANRSRLAHLRVWLRRRGAAPSEAALDNAFASLEREADRVSREGGQLGPEQAVPLVLRALGVAADEGEMEELVAEFADPKGAPPPEPAPGAKETLLQLRAHGLRLGIVSNLGYRPAPVMRRILDDAGLLGLFEPEAVVFSDEAGARKPSPAIFESALDALDARPAEAAHVGDSKAYDVRPARLLGMTTVRYRALRDDDTGETEEADYVIDRFGDLVAVLGLAEPRPAAFR
jgi:HAD superfamily hydrolase (TIGR01549 family)